MRAVRDPSCWQVGFLVPGDGRGGRFHQRPLAEKFVQFHAREIARRPRPGKRNRARPGPTALQSRSSSGKSSSWYLIASTATAAAVVKIDSSLQVRATWAQGREMPMISGPDTCAPAT